MSLGTLMLYNGEITKNEIVNGNGAGVCVDGGKFYMYNGSISNNKVSYSGNGGGVYAKITPTSLYPVVVLTATMHRLAVVVYTMNLKLISQ